MPGKGGRPQSLWWSHFQMVGGQFQYFRFWKHFEETSKANEKIVKALLKVVRQHLNPHLVQPMLKGCSLMGGWLQLIIDLPYQEKSWTKFSFCEKMRWWQTLILAGYKKHSFVFQCTTKTIHMWWTKYNIYSSFLLLRGEGGCVCVRVFFTHPLVIRSGSFFFYDIFHMNWFQ